MADRKTFEQDAVPLMDSLYRAARAISGNEHDARDLVQTTYLKAWKAYDRYKGGASCKAWMMTIMRNTWTDQLRRRKVAGTVLPLEEELLPAGQEHPAPAESLADAMERFSDRQVVHVLLELPEPQRLAVFLSDVEGMDQAEVAEVLEVPVGTVKSRISRARALLREKLKAHARDLGFLGRRSCPT